MDMDEDGKIGCTDKMSNEDILKRGRGKKKIFEIVKRVKRSGMTLAKKTLPIGKCS